MLQRVQTIYLAITIILLAVVSLGVELFSLLNDDARFTFNSYGFTTTNLDGEVIAHSHFPFYLGTIALLLLSFICLMSYKNLDRQLKLGRSIFGIYFLMVVGMVILTYVGDSFTHAETNTRELGLGFFLFVIGFPFTFLANIGIKRDKRLLDSLNRLR